MANVSVDEFKAAMASFAAGVTVITTIDEDGAPFGLTATAFCSLSKAPPMCLVCVSHDAEAHPVIKRTGSFTVNMLREGQDERSTRFAISGADKFADIEWTAGDANGCPLLPGSIAQVECRLSEAHTQGDHDVLIGAIEAVHVSDGSPLLYHRGKYRRFA